MVKSGKRSVSIIGAGTTPIGDVRSTPGMEGCTEKELFAMASINAMEDAGVTPADLDAFYVGISGPNYDAKIKSAPSQFGNWIGMQDKPSFFHDEGCATGCYGLEAAVDAVASGRYDCVISTCVNINTCTPKACYPPFIRSQMDNETLWNTVYSATDPAFEKPGYGGAGPLDALPVLYCRKYGVSLEELDDAYVTYLLGKRREAMMNPIAVQCTMSYEDEARFMGFDDVREYLKSDTYNPLVGTVIRARYLGQTNVDASAAVIVCATELADRYKGEPVEVAGISTAVCMGGSVLTLGPTEQMIREVYNQAGITDPYNEIQLLSVHDCPISTVVPVGEAAGYFKKGEGWKAMRDGELNFDGSKPANTCGSRTQTGHPRSPAFNIELRECRMQMLGKAGDRQMLHKPKASLLWAGGAAWNLGAVVLKAL